MNRSSNTDLSRRDFLAGASSLAVTSLLGGYAQIAAADAPPETTKIRLVHLPSICLAPQYIAQDLLRLEGFTDIKYYPFGTRIAPQALADGRADISMWSTPGLILP